MIELTPHARVRLDDYLAELRRVLSGSSAVSVEDVERDVRDHVNAALHGHAQPVQATVLDEVLKTLGSPSQWLPEGESGWSGISPREWLEQSRVNAVELAKTLARGPESYRLPYLSLLVLAAGWCLGLLAGDPLGGVIGLIGTLVSFILARAALTLYEPAVLTSAQKWLLYPSLLVIYVPLAAVLLLGPFLLGMLAMEQRQVYEQSLLRQTAMTVGQLEMQIRRLEQRGGAPEQFEELRGALRQAQDQKTLQLASPMTSRWMVIASGMMGGGAGLLVIGLLGLLLPAIWEAVFFPFLPRNVARRVSFLLLVLGSVCLLPLVSMA